MTLVVDQIRTRERFGAKDIALVRKMVHSVVKQGGTVIRWCSGEAEAGRMGILRIGCHWWAKFEVVLVLIPLYWR